MKVVPFDGVPGAPREFLLVPFAVGWSLSFATMVSVGSLGST